MRSTTGASAPQPLTFAVSADREPVRQLAGIHVFDVVNAAIEQGAQRVEGELSDADLAEIDSDFAAERRRQEADSHNNHLKNTGELDRRRIERAGPSPFEREYMRDHQR